MGDFTFWL